MTEHGTLRAAAVAVTAFVAAMALRVGVVDAQYVARLERDAPDVLATPGYDVLQITSLQHPLAAADLFWLSIVQEIGAKGDTGEPPDPDRLLRWAMIATDLDPHYLTVYYSTALNLTAYARDADKSDALLEKGARNMPNEWTMPFLMGYNDYFIRGLPDDASAHWESASKLPERPSFLLSLAARARYQAGDERGAEAVLEEMIPHLTGPAKEDAVLRLKAFRSEPTLAAYDRACEAYRAETGELPTAEALHAEGRVAAPPEDEYGAPIELDDNCIARTKYIRIREDEARSNVGSQSPTSPLVDGLEIKAVPLEP